MTGKYLTVFSFFYNKIFSFCIKAFHLCCRMMPGTMPIRGPQGQSGPRAGTSMRGGPMGRGDYGKYGLLILLIYSKENQSVLSLLVSQVTIPKYAKK